VQRVDGQRRRQPVIGTHHPVEVDQQKRGAPSHGVQRHGSERITGHHGAPTPAALVADRGETVED
jgi:hypothetical protein